MDIKSSVRILISLSLLDSLLHQKLDLLMLLLVRYKILHFAKYLTIIEYLKIFKQWRYLNTDF
jgi:hypothetical protein